MSENFDLEKEKEEALEAGRIALSALEKAQDYLSSARSWGIFDTIFKGGLISGLVYSSNPGT